jgi:dTDP-4-amino-4,6-dideoxygalactose transaminase
MNEQKTAFESLAIEGGQPVRTEPLPLEFPGAQWIDEREVEAAVRVLRSRSLFRYRGIQPLKEAHQLEVELSHFVGVKYAVAVSSGTGALHTALSALGVGPGQEVLIPAYLWVAVAAAVVNLGAIPVLIDIDDTFCLDPSAVERQITPKTTGMILVHMSGAPGDVKALRAIAQERGLFLLEDCAQCAGGSVDGEKVGSFGDMATFSFQNNKNMTSGEGGCVVTNDQRLYRRALACHDMGFPRDEGGALVFDEPEMCLFARGYRLDELRAAVLRVQLQKLPCIVDAMRRSKRRIRQVLEPFSRKVQLRRIPDPEGDTGCFLITTYADPETAKKINLALRAEGIVTYPQGVSNIVLSEFGLHLYYNNLSMVLRNSMDGRGFPWNLAENKDLPRSYGKGTCPVADSLFERSILLAIPSCLTRQDEDDIIRAFEKVLGTLL